jgi:mono/diheme cytochrome c family protein
MSKRSLLVFLPVVALGCAAESEETATPTYHRDVQPLIEQHCSGCHQPGEIGQGALTSYAEVLARAPAIKAEVVARRMPPWLAAQGCNEYSHDRSLGDDEIALISAWVDAGAPEGDPEDAPERPQKVQQALSRVDRTLTMPVDYAPVREPDDYRCFIVDWPEADVSYVTGVGVRPGNATTVHHVIAFLAPPAKVADYQAMDEAEEGPGYTCYGGPGGTNAEADVGFLAAWAPGMPPSDYPAGTGIRIEPGSKVILQVHYNTITWDGAMDRSEVDVKIDREVTKEARWAFYTNPAWLYGDAMTIPAGDPDVTHSFALDVTPFLGGGPLDIYQVGLHMHTRGVSASLDIQRADGSESCMLRIPRWDFDWQFPYEMTQPLGFEVGDKLRITCNYDNSPENQPVVDGTPMPPRDISWGEGTDDEMCLSTVYLVTR